MARGFFCFVAARELLEHHRLAASTIAVRSVDSYDGDGSSRPDVNFQSFFASLLIPSF